MGSTSLYMFYVYVLYSTTSDKYYVGHTEYLEERIARHNSVDHNGWTKRYQPWELHWQLGLTTRSKAMLAEQYLKKKPRDYIRRLAEDQALSDYILKRFI